VEFKEIVAENIPSILTAAVSIISIVSVSYQTHSKEKNETAKKYIDMKFSAYKDFINAIACFDAEPNKNTFSTLISASNKAMILSHPAQVEMFDNFCRVQTDLAEAYQNESDSIPELESELNKALKIIRFIMQIEMLEFDPSKHKLTKRLLRRRRIRNFLKKVSQQFKAGSANKNCCCECNKSCTHFW